MTENDCKWWQMMANDSKWQQWWQWQQMTANDSNDDDDSKWQQWWLWQKMPAIMMMSANDSKWQQWLQWQQMTAERQDKTRQDINIRQDKKFTRQDKTRQNMLLKKSSNQEVTNDAKSSSFLLTIGEFWSNSGEVTYLFSSILDEKFNHSYNFQDMAKKIISLIT